MKTFIFDFFNKVKRTSETLDAKTIICNKTWRVFTDGNEKEIYIFMEDGKLVISYNGIVTMGSWMYIPANHSLVISGNNQNFLVYPILCNNMLALIVDGTNQCAFLLDDTINELKRINTLENIIAYISNNQYVKSNQLTIESTINSASPSVVLKTKQPIQLETCKSFIGLGGYEYVDLGLSVYWASYDLGTKSPYEKGEEFMYGDGYGNKTLEYKCARFKWLNEIENDKLIRSIKDNICGIYGLDPATTKMGSEWRLPSYHEAEELVNRCIWTYIDDGELGYTKVTGPNGNFIYFKSQVSHLCGCVKYPNEFNFSCSYCLFTTVGSSLPTVGSKCTPKMQNYEWKYGKGHGRVRAIKRKK